MPAGIGPAQPADQHEIGLRQPEPGAHLGDLVISSPVHAGVRGLRDHRDALALHPEVLDGVARHRLGGDDHPCGPLHRELAKARAHAAAQVLARALEHREVMERDDGRARTVEQRALEPRGVEHVGSAAAERGRWALGFEQLVPGDSVSRRALSRQRA